MPSARSEVTQLLVAWGNGDEAALDRLMPLVYEELRRRARHYMSGQPAGHTLQPTALIHEAFLKLVGSPERHWQNRTHFLAVAAQAMRQVLVDYARAVHCAKRRGGLDRIDLDDAAIVSPERAGEFVALDDALSTLAQMDARKARVIELRYFGGLNVEEVAELLDTSPATVMRDWQFAKSWLRRELTRRERHDI